MSTGIIEKKQELLDSVVTSLPLRTVSWQVGPPVESVELDYREDEPDNPYPYGWRYIPELIADGRITWDKVALSLKDNLHPEEEDYLMPRPPHSKNTKYIGTALEIHSRNDPTAFVSDDLNVDLNLPGVKPIRPDIAIFFDVTKKRAWGTFDTQEEGTKPTVVFEVTSPSTRHLDFGEKRNYYAQAGIPYYVILDIEYETGSKTNVREYTLHVYELVKEDYVEVQPNSEGRYWLPPLDMFVDIDDDGILCYDAQENVLLDHMQLYDALADVKRQVEEQEQLAKQEAQRAQDAILAQQEAEAEIARLRAIVAQMGGKQDDTE